LPPPFSAAVVFVGSLLSLSISCLALCGHIRHVLNLVVHFVGN
jgi:hypothetical protein